MGSCAGLSGFWETTMTTTPTADATKTWEHRTSLVRVGGGTRVHASQDIRRPGEPWTLPTPNCGADHAYSRLSSSVRILDEATDAALGRYLRGLCGRCFDVEGIRARLEAPVATADTEPLPRQYLAWGGEAEGFTIVTAKEIRKDIEQGHYSDYRAWRTFAWIDGENPPGPFLIDVEVVGQGRREIDDDDYMHQSFAILISGIGVDRAGTVLDEFSTRIDGRA